MLRRLTPSDDDDLLVGPSTHDDAGVYRLDDDRALVVTTDFFTPLVDDPYDFGRIAAANSLSDVYAMGARPLLAMNLNGFPSGELDAEVLDAILRGGGDTVREAGAVIAGGHSIDDKEPKYGLAVVGEVHPDRILRNRGGRPGDRLILTKPLGTGIISTAIKKGTASSDDVARITELMATLNRDACEVLAHRGEAVGAVTDVTGYGLLGHLLEMLDEEQRVGARLHAGAVPILDAARHFAEGGTVPGGSRANLDAVRERVRFEGELAGSEHEQLLLADAQTSGGLLAMVRADEAPAVLDALRAAGVTESVEIGEVVEGDPVVEVVR